MDVPPAPPPTALTTRGAQRADLAELVRIAADCARLDADNERALAEARKTADQTLRRAKTVAAEKFDADAAVQLEQRDARAADLAHARDASVATADEAFADRRSRVMFEYDGVSSRLRKKQKDALWLAEGVLESEGARLGAELDAAKVAQRDHRKTLDALHVDALNTAATFNLPVADDDRTLAPTDAPAGDVETATEEAQTHLAAFKRTPLANLFVGVKPYFLALLIVAAAALATQPWARDLKTDWKPTAYAAGGALLALAIAWPLLLRAGRRRAAERRAATVAALSRAVGAASTRLADAQRHHDAVLADVKRTRDAEVQKVRAQFGPLLEKATRGSHEHLNAAQKERDAAAKSAADAHAASTTELTRAFDASTTGARAERTRTDASAQDEHDVAVRAAERAHAKQQRELEDRWQAGLARTRQDASAAKAPDVAGQFGTLRVDLAQVARESGAAASDRLPPPPPYDVPALLCLPRDASLLIEFDRDGRDAANQLLRATVHSLLTTLPPGRARFTFVDPVGLGETFAAFMHLADHDDALVGQRIWTEPQHVEQRLADLSEHMETVIQKYLRNEYETIDDYNRQAGELAEPYRFLVVADLPAAFSDEALRRLANVATSGPRCGVYVVVAHDARTKLPPAIRDDLHRACATLKGGAAGFRWQDETLGRFAFQPATLPDDATITRAMHDVGAQAVKRKRVEVPFTTCAPKPGEEWSLSSAKDLGVPVGRTGATRLQTFRLGRGVAQHALVAGKTGSGKSTLLNALITSCALWYSPRELELYLIDFKRGVEFKLYAEHKLPHARAIAVESDREFGLSVLQRLDAELGRRGELYRAAGVQDLAGYRAARPDEAMPRVLLVIDEFQEIFADDDRISQDASALLDRLVRQGRAFGMHAVLGSQTIGGGGVTLPRATFGQMAVRVALACTEADSQLILGDNNGAARLLSRPGEAIYNDAGGSVEANSPFQVAWLGDETRDRELARVRSYADTQNVEPGETVVFEGNVPAKLTDNRPLQKTLKGDAPLAETARLYLGEAVAIKPPTAAALQRRAGANVIVVGQADELSTGILRSALLSAARPGATVILLDATPADSQLAGVLARAATDSPAESKLVSYRDAGPAVADLAELVRTRTADADPPDAADRVFLFVNGLQRYRDLRKTDDFGGGGSASFSFDFSADAGGDDEKAAPATKAIAPDKAFAEVLRDGPAVGVHVVAAVDTLAALERVVDRGLVREFDYRVLLQMSASDSSQLVDSPAANKLGANRALVFSEEQGTVEKFRPYGAEG